MDPTNFSAGLVNKLVSGIKDKTAQLAEAKFGQSVEMNPSEAILCLVASAVRSGASRLEVRVQANDLVLSHDGRMLQVQEISQLGRANSACAELAEGLKLHFLNGGTSLHIDFLSDVGMHQASFSQNSLPSVSDADLSDLKLAKLTTRLVLKGSGNLRRVNQAMGGELPEVTILRKRCFLAPLAIEVSGRPLDRNSQLPDSLVYSENFNSQANRALELINLNAKQGNPVDLRSLASQLRAISSGVCGIALDQASAGWYRLVDGLAVPLSEINWPSRTWGYITTSAQSTPQALNEEVLALVGALTLDLFKGLSSLSGELTLNALGYLEMQRSALLKMGVSQVDQDRAFLEARSQCSPSSDPKLVNNRLELAGSLLAAGQKEEAEKLYRDILPVWESEALNHFDKYRYEEGASLWQRALDLHERLGSDPRILAEKYLKMAEVGRKHRLGFAEQSYRRCLRLVKSFTQPDKSLEFKVLVGLAGVLKRNRVLTESLRIAEEAHQLFLEIHDGQENRELVPILKLQAEIHDLLDDYIRSTEFEQKALLLKFKR